MKYKPGDILVYRSDKDCFYRRITLARRTGYSWEYLDRDGMYHDEEFASDNSTDPMLTQWTLILRGATRP